jgi:hypothetical protein
MSSIPNSSFHTEAQPDSEVTRQRRAIQNLCGQLNDAKSQLASREWKYVPIRAANGRTQVWIQRLKQWVVVLEGDGEATTKDIHDAIRKWELKA